MYCRLFSSTRFFQPCAIRTGQQLTFGPMARPNKLPRVLTEEETDRLLAQPDQRYFGPHRDYLFMRLMLKAGLRVSEATSG